LAGKLKALSVSGIDADSGSTAGPVGNREAEPIAEKQARRGARNVYARRTVASDKNKGGHTTESDRLLREGRLPLS
jgi:hypothetical protein